MLRRAFVLLSIVSALAGAAAWIVSPEMAENWAFTRSPTAEAVLDARALLWFLRVAAPLTAFIGWVCLRRWPRTERFLHRAGHELWEATGRSDRATSRGRVCSLAILATAGAWLLLAAVQWIDASRRVVQEWPVYGTRSGAQVLPNMSESNRDVIRYLAEATPEHARILAASDQTLFFLSYYLWPRVILQRRHPDSEFIVPQPDQARQLAAYRLSDFTADEIAALDVDFVLEYFEGPEFVEPDRVLDDRMWIEFFRQRHGDRQYTPSYNVRLRPIAEMVPAP